MNFLATKSHAFSVGYIYKNCGKKDEHVLDCLCSLHVILV